MRKRFGVRPYAGLTAGQRRYVGLTTVMAVAALVLVPLALAGAINTTTDSGQTVNSQSTGVCVNGPDPSVNCNLYSQKEDVFLSGSPTAASLATGTYYFAVLDPGGQPDPNPGAVDLLSSDAALQREFSITDSATGAIAYSGSHVFDSANNKLSAFPFNDTTNNGGVYIMAVCKISSTIGDFTATPSVDPHVCKYDAFKVKKTTTPPVGTASNLDISKTAIPAFNRNYGWDMAKSVDKTKVEQIGGNATFTYTVTATWRNLGDSTWHLTGHIDVTNPNTQDVTGVTIGDVVSYGVSDTADGNANCKAYNTVTSAYDRSFPLTNQTVPNAGLTISYDCAYTAAPADTLETNTASVSWGTQCLAHDPNDATVCTLNLPASSSPITYPVPFTWDSPTLVNNTSTLTDTFGLSGGTGTAVTLGVAGVDGSWVKDAGNTLWDSSHNLLPGIYNASTNTFTFVYSRSIALPAHGCLSYTNTVTESTLTSPDPDNTIDTRTVTACGPAATGALTMGFWKGPNGQALISNYGSGLYTWLHGLGPNASGPFSTVNSLNDINAIFKAASATNMNAMLRAQMLATTLDYYFGTAGLGWSSSPIGKIKPPSNFLTQDGLKNFTMDMTSICPMVDNLSTGTATCSNSNPSTNGFTAGAFPAAAMTTLALLNYEASNPPYTTAGSPGVWYAGDRTKEEIAKNAFDQINNGDAFAP
jgi:hypothetical protein